MQLTKAQKIYIFSSIIFIGVVIAVPLLKQKLLSTSNGNHAKPELANLKEVGKTRILEGNYRNATFTLRLKYEDQRRQSFFENSLAESWGFNADDYHVFLFDVKLDKIKLQTLPNGENIAVNNLTTFEIGNISVKLFPQNLTNIDLASLKLENPTKQGEFEKGLQIQPIKMKEGEIATRFLFFKKSFKFDEINSATIKLPSGDEVKLTPKDVEYAIPPTVPAKTAN